jgi:ABC-type polysaccharide/polyol phosphate transport system ATPase subunit
VTVAAVRADGLSKRFRVLRSQKSVLRALRSLVGGEPVYRDHHVLRGLTFAMRPGEKVALVGRNGSGKSTLLRIISGIYEPSGGTVELSGRLAALFDPAIGFLREISVTDNIYLYGALHGISRDALAPCEQAILQHAALEHLAHAPLKDLSMGQVRRLAISVFMQNTADVLVFDEVLANLDDGFVQQAERYFAALAASDRTVIMTSHSAALLRRTCTRGLWLEDGDLRMDGPVDAVLDAYQRTFKTTDADGALSA